MPFSYLGVLFLLGAIWGATFLLIKVSVLEIPPVTLVAVRLVIASLILVGVLYGSGLRLPATWRTWRDFFVVGSIGLVVPFMLIAWGQRLIPTSMTAILNGAVPIFSVLVALGWTREESLSGLKLLGVAIGFVGVMLAVGVDGLLAGSDALYGELAVLGATLCYAVSGIYGRLAFRGFPAMVPATGQLLAGALLIAPVAVVLHDLPPQAPSLLAIGSLLGLAVVCTAFAYILLYWLMERIGATRTSMVTYLIAPFGILYGALLLHEDIAPGALGGLGLVVIGILLTNGTLRMPARTGMARPDRQS
jgi:drug/metabolite transporter (DMT)-like permease